MKKSTSLFAIIFILGSTVIAQVPRFSKYQINQTGRYVYLPADPGEFEVAKSEDGSDVYTREVTSNEFNFAIIMVNFADGAMEEQSPEDLEEVLTSYLDFLQTQFGVTDAAGYGRGHTMESNPNARGVIDYWQDSDSLQYAVKGWVDKETLAVLLLYGKGDYPYFNAQEMFLNGFRFN